MTFTDGIASLARIDPTDNTYRISTETDVAAIRASIRSIGLVNPPIFLPDDHRLIVVSGFRRVQACRDLGQTAISGRFLTADASCAQCIRLAITENALQRNLNDVELSRAYTMLWTVCPNSQRLASEALTLGLPANPAYIKKVQPICRMPQAVQQGILDRSIALATANELDGMPAQAAEAFAALFGQLRVSLNKQREIITLIREIAARDDRTVLGLIQGDRIQGILKDTDGDRGQKLRVLKAYLLAKRFPTLHRFEAGVRESIRQLKLGDGVFLARPKNFEAQTYSLTLTFKTMAQFRERHAEVTRLASSTVLSDILNPGRNAAITPAKPTAHR